MNYGAPEISTAALTTADVPSADGSLEMERAGEFPAIWKFATTYPLPAAMPRELPAFVAQSALAHWGRQAELPPIGLDGLRLTLWWMSEHWRHTNSEGGWERRYPKHAAFARALLKEIHLVLYDEESWSWDPDRQPSDEERWQRALGRSAEAQDIAELYEIAVDLLSVAIERRESGTENPLDVPLQVPDPLRATRVHTAALIMRGLVCTDEGSTLEEARDEAYAVAASLKP